MNLDEKSWDKLLNIKTSGRDASNADTYHYPYEPTDYRVLERLAQSGLIGKENTLIDYGCGKGRVDFFLSYQIKCHTIGVEYDERIYNTAMNNYQTAVSKNRVTLELANAEQYTVPEQADRFYFFNPFPVPVLQKVLERVKESYYANPRDMYFFFYYPSVEYVAYLMTVDELLFVDEIDCADLYKKRDERERIIVFQLL